MRYDIESGEIITAAQLLEEFKTLQAEQPDEYPYPFAEYIGNCTSKNGTLIPVKKEA